MKRFNVLHALAVLFVFSQIALGAVPQLINFQGILKDGSGNPVADGSYSVTFTIYDAPSGGNVQWQEVQSVTTSNGLFTVLLGATTPVPDSAFHDTSRYLGIAVSPDPEMTLRQRLASVGYSSVSSQWTSAGENLFRLSGKVGIGESNPLNTLTIGSNGGWTSTGLFPGILMGTTSGQTKQILIGRDEGNFVQLAYDDNFGFASARLLVQGNHPLSITTDGSLYINTGGSNRMFISNAGDVGIGTTSPAKRLDVVGSIKTSDTLFASNVSSNSPLQLQAPAGTMRMFINDANGNVGIGTASPGSKLDVAGGNFNLENSTSSAGNILKGGDRFIHNFGTNNTFIGSNTGNLTMTGFGNTASGGVALQTNTTGSQNTASGYSALVFNTSGNQNTACGYNALIENTTGSNNTAIGYNAGVTVGTLTNATAIGNGALVGVSNKIRLGNSDVTVIEGQVAYTFTSDKNEKENFRPVDGEEILRKLRNINLTSWNYKGHDPKQFRHYGPMAQDFFAAFGDDGVGKIGIETFINSGDMAGILMIAVQALEERTAEVAELKARIEALEKLQAVRR